MVKVFDKIGEFAKNTKDKANDALEVSRLNSKIGTEQGKIADAKLMIGEYYWKKAAQGETLDPQAEEICKTIREAEGEIGALKAQIERIKSGEQTAQQAGEAESARSGQASGAAKTCAQCGADNAEDAQFCKECGAKLPAPVPDEPEARAFCVGCGAPMEPGARFCGKCGQRV